MSQTAAIGLSEDAQLNEKARIWESRAEGTSQHPETTWNPQDQAPLSVQFASRKSLHHHSTPHQVTLTESSPCLTPKPWYFHLLLRQPSNKAFFSQRLFPFHLAAPPHCLLAALHSFLFSRSCITEFKDNSKQEISHGLGLVKSRLHS